MGLITTMGKFSYIQCDMRNCGKKIEKSGEDQLKELAHLCGWEARGGQWICPSCVEKDKAAKKAKRSSGTKSKREAQM